MEISHIRMKWAINIFKMNIIFFSGWFSDSDKKTCEDSISVEVPLQSALHCNLLFCYIRDTVWRIV